MDNEFSYGRSPLSAIDPFHAQTSQITRTLSITSRWCANQVSTLTSRPRRRPNFRYKRLPTTTSIRLLQVIECLSPDEIHCSLIVRDVRDKPWYNCLSYTWGNPLPAESATVGDGDIDWKARDYSIICNNRNLSVTRSLRDTLWQISQGPAKAKLQRIWIDAVCIDQDDIPERSAQVLLMHDIYRLSQSVVVWLGPETHNLSNAIDVMKMLSWTPAERFDRACSFHYSQDEPYKRLGIPPIQEHEWQACSAFFERSWFGRAWIFQEAVLARDLMVICGSKEISWDDIAHTSWFLNVSQWDSKIGLEKGSDRNVVYSARYISKSRDARREKENRRFLSFATTYDFLLERGRALFGASDPRDMIYAILGCSHPDFQRWVIPDYSKSVSEVFTRATWALLRCTGDFGFLSGVEDASRRRTPALPSWVPDYSVPSYPLPLEGPLENGRNTYHAAAAKRQMISVPDRPGTVLTLSGLCIDQVVCIGESYEELFTPLAYTPCVENIIMQLDYPSMTGESNVEAFWRTLIGNTFGGIFPASSALVLYFRAWITWKVAWLLRKVGAPDFIAASDTTEYKAYFNSLKALDSLARIDNMGLLPAIGEIQACVATLEMFKLDPSITPEVYSMALLFDNETSIIFSGRRLLRTGRKLLGLGPMSTKIGDEVWIIPGANVPIILRKSSVLSYHLVGETYIHGIMQGEALEHVSPTWESIKIE